MIVFSVAIPVDAPAKVFDLVRGAFAFLRGLLSMQDVNAVFGEIPEPKKESSQEGSDE